MNQGAILLAARAYEGVREDPIGSNWGPVGHPIRKMLAAVHLDAPASWCAAFVCQCIKDASGGSFPAKFHPSGAALKLWELNPEIHVGKAVGAPDPEDLAIYDHGGGHGHVDIVETSTTVSGRKGYAFSTIGGNTNKGGGRQGIGVFSGISRTSEDPLLVGFLRLVGRV